MQSHFHPLLLLTLVMTVSVTGCGQRNENQSLVHGTVLVDGQPLANGEIRFTPLEGTEAPVSGASIQQGKYLADGRGGVLVGKYRVSILGYRAPKQSESLSPDELPPATQFIPPQYNDQSDLTVEVPSGGLRIEANFEIQL